jgi:hypothetical protein
MAMFSLVWSQLDIGGGGGVKEGASCSFGGGGGSSSNGVVAEGELVKRWMRARAGA